MKRHSRAVRCTRRREDRTARRRGSVLRRDLSNKQLGWQLEKSRFGLVAPSAAADLHRKKLGAASAWIGGDGWCGGRNFTVAVPMLRFVVSFAFARHVRFPVRPFAARRRRTKRAPIFRFTW